MAKQQKLAQRVIYANGHNIYVGLTDNVGYISIVDNNLYPNEHSGAERMKLNFNTMMIPCMTREQLKDLRTAIDEVLKHSK